MIKRKSYTEQFTLQSDQPKEHVVEKLMHYFQTNKQSEEYLELKRTPKILHFLAVRGTAVIHFDEAELSTGSLIEGKVRPAILFSRAGTLIFLVLVAICSGILLLFPFSEYILLGFILEWLLATIFAPYLLLACTFIWMILVLTSSALTTNTIITLLLAWLLTFWIIHLSLNFNKRQLKRYFLKTIRKAIQQ